MRISEAIELLKHIKKEVGDIPVVSMDEDGEFSVIDYHRTFDVIDFPNDQANKMETVCAFMEIQEHRPKLHLVPNNTPVA